ncbi:DUF1310 family protein [Companilactobacillus ginsenosidimutans]|nr:DUF1310 family protein [Companilactobacillus ginsenosidimutans]
MILFLLFFTMIIAVGVFYHEKSLEFQSEMVRIVKDNENKIDSDLLLKDKQRKIKDIDLNYDTIMHNSMGTIDFKGFVNGETYLSFQGDLSLTDGEINALTESSDDLFDFLTADNLE